MPALRLATRRRRSSHAIFTPAKPGIYGIPAPRPVPVTFAPNVTPVTFTSADPDDAADPSNPLSSYALAAALGNPSASGLLTSKLFPPSETPAPAPTRKRCPPGKRRSQGYIPRPPNAFMLFRADFVRQKHVPGSIETNHGSLSKIIGTCWRQLPLEEKRVWEVKAKQEKAAHKAMFPDYRFRPVHNKNKQLNTSSNANTSSFNSSSSNAKDDDSSKRREKQPTTAEDERRCDDVAALLLEGKKGEELARAVRNLDRARSLERSQREHDEREMMEEYELELEAEHDEHELPTPQDDGSAALRMPAPSFIDPFASSPFASNTHMYLPNTASNHLMSHTSSAMYHRRSSSVPLPNEWQPHSFSQFNHFGNANGIAIPTVPQFASRPVSPVGSIARFTSHFTDPFSSALSASSSNNNTPNTAGEYQFLPIPEFTPAGSAFPTSSTPSSSLHLFHPVPHHTHSHSMQNAIPPSQHMYTTQPMASTTTMHHPQPLAQPLPMLPFMTQTTPRSSLGLGQRRASSAQGILMRSWTMPLSFGSVSGEYEVDMGVQGTFDYSNMNMDMDMGMYGGVGGVGVVAKDPSPLPDVESGLFSDFSFGGESQSQSSSTTSPSTTDSAVGSSQSRDSASIQPSPPLSRSHTHALSLGLGLDLAIPPTSLSRIDTSLTYSPTQLPPPSALSTTSSSASAEASPLSATGGLPETPAVSSSAAGDNTNTGAKDVESTMGGVGGAGRLPSLDISAYMHLDGLYSESAFDGAHQHQHEQYAPSQYGEYYGYDVDPVEKRNVGETYSEGYYEATA